MTFRRVFLALLASLTLASCGNQSSQLASMSVQKITGLFKPKTPEVPLRQRLTPQALQEIGTPILIVELLKDGAEAGAQLQVARGDLEVWTTLNSVQFYFRKGVLISTRGLAGDLMASDVSQVLRNIRNGGKDVVRVNRYLDGEDQEVTRSLICDYASHKETVTVLTGTYATTRVDETCTSSTDVVENRYWFDGSGKLRKSVQWIGPFAGYLAVERIND